MRGHEALVAMRRRGVRPAMADISDGLDKLCAWRDWPDWDGTAHIEIQPADSIPLLDLRCLVGLFVFVWGLDAERVHQLHDACMAAGARAVMGAVYERNSCGELRRVDSIETIPEIA